MMLAYENPWLVWQLLDSAFPAGGFAHSGGLEAAWQSGEVKGRQELSAYIMANLVQVGGAVLPFVEAGWELRDEWERWAQLDWRCEATLTNPVANRASRAQGQAFIATAERIYGDERLKLLRSMIRTEGLPGHYGPVFGATVGTLGIPRQKLASLFMFMSLRGLVSAAVRLGIVGPNEGQAIQHELSAFAAEVGERFEGWPVEEAAGTSPVVDVLQGGQDRLYSRLFQS